MTPNTTQHDVLHCYRGLGDTGGSIPPENRRGCGCPRPRRPTTRRTPRPETGPRIHRDPTHAPRVPGTTKAWACPKPDTRPGHGEATGHGGARPTLGGRRVGPPQAPEPGTSGGGSATGVRPPRRLGAHAMHPRVPPSMAWVVSRDGGSRTFNCGGRGPTGPNTVPPDGPGVTQAPSYRNSETGIFGISSTRGSRNVIDCLRSGVVTVN